YSGTNGGKSHLGGMTGRVFALILACSCAVKAGFELDRGGARARSLGGAYTALTDDCWSVEWDVGALVQLRSAEISASVSPGLYGFRELSTLSLAAGLPLHMAAAALGVRKFGSGLYREIAATGALAWNLEGVGVGIGCSWYQVIIDRY